MITTLRPTKHAGSSRHRLHRRPGAGRAPAAFSGTLFRLRPRVEWMEDRTLLATILVSNTADSGPGSLRQAIINSNAAKGTTNTIDFDIPGQGVQVIAPASPLPAITQAVLIDGFSQPRYAATPLIELSGSRAGIGDGLTITGPDVTVRGLDIGGFAQGVGILLSGSAATGDVIAANDIGTDPTGTQALPNDFGARILDGAHGNLVGGGTAATGNLIAFNDGPGVDVEGNTSVGNRITANRIFANEPTPQGTLQFEGAGDVSLPDNLINGFGQNETIEAWFQTNQGGAILGYQQGDPATFSYSSGWYVPALYVGSDGKLYGELQRSNDSQVITSPGEVNDGQWHHVALVVDGASQVQTLYLDGQSVGSLSGPIPDIPAVNNQIGTAYSAYYPAAPNGWDGFIGRIADVRIWSTARSAYEVRQDLRTTLSGTEPGLEAAYRFDEGQGLTAHDLTPNSNDGTLAGFNGTLPTWILSSGEAIDLGGRGVISNSTSPRQGPNNLQNFPIIVTTAGGQLEGRLAGSRPNTSFRIDVFASASSSPTGAGQAEDFLGSLAVTTDSAGQAIFDIPFTPPAGLPVVTATATDPQGNTSEVSALRQATVEAPAQALHLSPGQRLTFSAASGDGLALRDPDAGPLDPAWGLTLSVPDGSLTLSSTTGLSGSGDGTASLSYSGSLSALNAALTGVTYTPPPGFQGQITLVLGARSDGAGPLQALVSITVTAGLFQGASFRVTNASDSGPGSLRQAILESNATPGGQNTIDFDIPGQGVPTIGLASPLPPITRSVLIDGDSQPGSAGTPRVVLDFLSSWHPDDLTIAGSDVTVRGLSVRSFALAAGSSSDILNLGPGLLQAGPNGRETYQIHATTAGLLVAQVRVAGPTTRLALLDSRGQVLARSDGLSTRDPDNVIDQHIAPGTYWLTVESLAGAGESTLSVTFTPASPPDQPIAGLTVSNLSLGSTQQTHSPGHLAILAVGDFTNNGILDIATPAGIYRGVGDGTFRNPTVGLGLADQLRNYSAIAAGDFNGDGQLDLALADDVRNTVVVLLGHGDGTFQAPRQYAVGFYPDALVAADFNGDGRLDLATANSRSNDVSILLGNGDGTFRPAKRYAAGTNPAALVAGDFHGDGQLDLAVADQGTGFSNRGGVSLLLGHGDGTFQPATPVFTGDAHGNPDSLVAGDFHGDGQLDLAVAEGSGVGGTLGADVVVLLGRGDGTFSGGSQYLVGFDPVTLVAGDFTGDGQLDLATVNTYNGNISVLPGRGDGTFRAQESISAAGNWMAGELVAGDFNGDGRLDLAAATLSYPGDSLMVLLSNGDGSFQPQDPTALGANPGALAAGDFTGNGRLDLAVVNNGDGTLSILRGHGNGTFQRQEPFGLSLGFGTLGDVVTGDFNGDGRLDLAVVGFAGQRVGIFLGNGDGTFQLANSYGLGQSESLFGGNPIVVGDFRGDGQLDLAVAGSDGVDVLLGKGNGTFQAPVLYPVPYPGGSVSAQYSKFSMVDGEFTKDGHLDLALTDLNATEVWILLGNGDGTFRRPIANPGVNDPTSLVAGDFRGDGPLDLAASNQDGSISILLGHGDGTFQPATSPSPPSAYYSPLVVGDFNGDGKLDLAALGNNGISVFSGNGDGTFQSPVISVENLAAALVTGDFNGDGKLDLAAITYNHDIATFQGREDGTFSDPGQLATPPHATPLVADVNGDGTEDVLVIDGAGDILDRQGIPGQPGAFEPPVTINPNNPARDIAWLPKTDQGPVLASGDAHDDAISFYAYRDGHLVRLIGSLPTGRLPAQIIAAQLNGDGLDDLVVRNAGDGTLSVYLATFAPARPFVGPMSALDPPSFLPAETLSVGLGVSDVRAVDTRGAGVLDLAVTNTLTGQVSVLPNLGDGFFAAPIPYRAGTGLSAVDPGSTPEVTSLEATAGVAAGPQAPGGPTSLVTINPGSNTMDILAGLGGGRFANPVTIETPSPAQVVRMGDFTGNGIDDLAVLTADGLNIYLGNGQGGFLPPTTYAVPSEANGLTIADLLGNGQLDLLVGDAYGDVLVLMGNGDGTFVPYHEANQSIELAVADLTAKGSKDVIYADQGLDRVVVDYGAGKSLVLADQSTGLLVPGAVALADLNGDGIPDLIVANSGSNNVLIYPGLGHGQFGPAVNGGHGYFVGTNPVGITVANLTGSLPDLVVADKGSNQVSILLNQGDFRFTPGPRLNTGGTGPVSTVVGHFTGGPYPDLLVTNSQSNDVALLPGVGQGFFNDQNPTIYPVGSEPGPTFVGTFNGQPDLVTVNAGSNDLTLISGFEGSSPVISTIASGGVNPDTAFAFSSGNGFEDLVVGNESDGALALFDGGPDGLSLMSVESEPGLPAPTDLAFSALTGGQVQFYAATAGRESAELVALSLGIETETIGALSAAVAAPTAPAVQLVALHETSLPLVATVLTLTLTVTGTELNLGLVEPEAAAVAAFLPVSGISVGQPVASARGGSGPAADEILPADDSGAGGAGAVPGAWSPWERVILGLDEALEEFRRQNPSGVAGHSEGTAPGDREGSAPSSTWPPQGVPTGARLAPDSSPRDGQPNREAAPSAAVRAEAVDAVMETMSGEDVLPRRERTSYEPDAPASESLKSSAMSGVALPLPSTRWDGAAPAPAWKPNRPGPVSASWIVAAFATKWVHLHRWRRSSRPRWSGVKRRSFR